MPEPATMSLPASRSELIRRAAPIRVCVLQHVRVNHGRLDVHVAEKFLDLAYVHATGEKVRSERMPKTVYVDAFVDSGLLRRLLSTLLVLLRPPAYPTGLLLCLLNRHILHLECRE